MKDSWHLHEAVIGNASVWLKLQASCPSTEPAGLFESRFSGADYIPADGRRLVTPFRLSNRSHHIANWSSIVESLPDGWDDEEFRIVETVYPWCDTLADGCDCHGTKGRLDLVHCSDFGVVEEREKRSRKTPNVRYEHYIREMEERITRRDEELREERRRRAQPPPLRGAAPTRPNARRGAQPDPARTLAQALGRLNGLLAEGLYCSIHGRHHAYGGESARKTVADLRATVAQVAAWPRSSDRAVAMSRMDDIAAHRLRVNQSQQCAERSVWGDQDVPDVVYKYIPSKLIGNGAPNSLRATELLALNDDMECNVVAMKGRDDEALEFLRLVQTRVRHHLGIDVAWQDLLTRWQRHADVRLSTYVQEYLNPRVGVVSFSTDILVPTMWAHYARNTGLVVGYDTEALKALGFELRPMLYSEIAPVWEPREGDDVRLDFVNRDDMERDLRAGREREGWPLLARTQLATFGQDWKSLSRLLFVKGMSWAYEKEVRLLVDLERARDTVPNVGDCEAIKVIDPPREAIREIHAGARTKPADIERAVQAARGEDRRGLFVGNVTSHAFRMQKTGGTRH